MNNPKKPAPGKSAPKESNARFIEQHPDLESLSPIIIGVYASCPAIPADVQVSSNLKVAWDHVSQCTRCIGKFAAYKTKYS